MDTAGAGPASAVKAGHRLSRRRLIGLGLTLPFAAACTPRLDVGPLYGIPTPTPTGKTRRPLLFWHADAVPGERLFGRDILPGFARVRPDVAVEPIAHGDPDDLLRRVAQAAAGGIGPDVFALPGEWLPDAATAGLVRPLDPETSKVLTRPGWGPGLVEAAAWGGAVYGVPAAAVARQPFYNDALLRDVGLIQNGRTTPPSTWDEFADVSKRVNAPDGRWGSLLPSNRADEDLFVHVYQHVYTAGGDLPRRDGGRFPLNLPAVRAALVYLADLVQKSGGLPLDRPPYRLAETGRAGLWWATPAWLLDQNAVGATLKAGAAPIPRRTRGGAVQRTRLWCSGAKAAAPDEAAAFMAYLAEDEVSHSYCAGLSLPPTRVANASRPPYSVPTPPRDGPVWRAVLDQLDRSDNVPLTTFPGYRPLIGRIAGEFVLVLTGKKPVDVALAEGEAGAAEVLKQADAAVRQAG